MSLVAQASELSLQQLFAAGLRVGGVDIGGEESLREQWGAMVRPERTSRPAGPCCFLCPGLL